MNKKKERKKEKAMFELTVGSHFGYKNKLYEVAEYNGACWLCASCLFKNEGCNEIKCSNDKRHDNKDVYFKELL